MQRKSNKNEFTTVRLRRELANKIKKEINIGEDYQDYIEKIYNHYKACKAV